MPPDPNSTDDVRQRWDEFARRAPLEYVRVGSGNDAEQFYASGTADVASILDFVGPAITHGRVLDLGCGPGRLLAPLAAQFVRVDGVDIAPEMLELAKASGLPANVHLTLSSGRDLSDFQDDSFDLVVALLVLQHIADAGLLASILADVRRVLRAEGRAFLQFDSRPSGLTAAVTKRLPDRLLPPMRRRHIRRTRRSSEGIWQLLADADLSVVRDRGADTADYHVCVRRPV